ncbi:hypothetical protein SESBI_15821 [Sesbania bispinosa]|nr:hypothetical protein SESBI_15821 [Sesbania bispinosa]
MSAVDHSFPTLPAEVISKLHPIPSIDEIKTVVFSIGQMVNRDKSRVFFSKNIDQITAQGISNILSMDRTEDLGVYLGFPVLHGRISKNTYPPIIDKVRKKLVGWKASSLSMAGRITLAQSTIMSMLNYLMQASVFPIGVCEEIERLCRNFI